MKISHQPPARLFTSDNAAGVHPDVMAAVVRANESHALAYGLDKYTVQAKDAFSKLFDADVRTEFVFGGTGANVLALACILKPAEAVVCTAWSHIAVDETGAPEKILGAKLIDLPSLDGKLTPQDLRSVAHLRGHVHHAQPAVVSITQSTELGTVYSPDEVRALCETAHELEMLVHMDGARLSNAAAVYGATPEALRSFTIDAGVDVLSFGAMKAGVMFGEAVVFLKPDLGDRVEYIRKQITQLNSKMRFISAQYIELFRDGLFFQLGAQANAMALALYERTKHHKSLGLVKPPLVNSLYPTMSQPARTALQDWSFFWDWDVAAQQVRWMTAWDTTLEDIEAFGRGVDEVLNSN
jgi:threonine aldolase